MMRQTWHCNHCNSKNVFEKALVNPNTGDEISTGDGEAWCEDCAAEHGLGGCTLVAHDNEIGGES
mgnify:CR=1 FL=1